MQQISKETLAAIELEYARWSEFMNAGVGLFAFNLGISCLGTPHPETTASISITFLFFFMHYGRKHFPKTISRLKSINLKDVDEITLLGIEKKYFGVMAIFTRFYVYLLGWLFLSGVAIYGVLK